MCYLKNDASTEIIYSANTTLSAPIVENSSKLPSSPLIVIPFGDQYSHANYYHFFVSLIAIYPIYKSLKPFIPSLRILLRVSHEQKFQQEWFDLLDLTHDDFIICNDDAIIFSGIIQVDNSSNSFCRMSMQYILDNYILPISNFHPSSTDLLILRKKV